MSERTKIVFAIPKLTAGGAERVISFVAQHLDAQKFEVTLLVVGYEKDNKYDVSQVNTIYLNKTRVRNSIWALIKTIQKLRPQIVLSSISDLNVVMGLISFLFPKTIFVGRHTFIAKPYTNSENKAKKPRFDIRKYSYQRLDFFICQSQDMKKSIIDVYTINANSIKVINNPITQTIQTSGKKRAHSVKHYITIGRLSKLKGYIRILEILHQVSFPFHYTIIGTGNYHDAIFDKVKALHLDDHVTYVAYTNNVYDYLERHDMYLQGSYSEGFPNALLESCAVGTPVLAFDVPGGTKEIVENEVNGYLVKDEAEFLEKLHANKQWNPEQIKASVYAKFGKEKIILEYEQFFQDIIN